MKTWDVLVTRDCTESTIIQVQAQTLQEAMDLAVGKAQQDYTLTWTRDGSEDIPYIVDDSCVEENDPA
ncbi:hypothetical protein [Acetonema longum]|uniref:Uncharacterized protein n=1 Tax=Acetonema longum DSM 6540 TaxID=1009370 RepID=F7NK88_9FIRM|nr:hypothetical protein [Acetonema longum]EGO63529.1 hypothetical protein ALO_12506 [Acetonema longum DSM 6540]